MHLRKILSGTLALILVTGATHAFETGGSAGATRDAAPPGPSFNLPGVSLPGLPGRKEDEGSVRYAQAGDPRITALEEQIRSLSGTIEELTFQVLQMQEQMRKMQEDNEFRFQELEKGRTNASGQRQGAVAPARRQAEPARNAEAAGPGTVEEVIVGDRSSGNASGNAAGAAARTPEVTPGAATGVPPQVFGTITFDDKGNVVGGSANRDPSGAPPPPRAAPAGTDTTVVAALPATDDPEELYRNSYEFILSGDYGTAESGFRDHIARFPKDPRSADARFWLGEALLGQKRYRDAAETFLAANKEFPSSRKAPDMLLKLGVSLVGLDQRDVACATFGEIARRYPDASAALKGRVKQEQALAAC